MASFAFVPDDIQLLNQWLEEKIINYSKITNTML